MNRASFLSRIALGILAMLGWKWKERKVLTATDILEQRRLWGPHISNWKGRTWFVAKNGKDTNDGLSYERPISMPEAMRRVESSEDIIYVLKSK